MARHITSFFQTMESVSSERGDQRKDSAGWIYYTTHNWMLLAFCIWECNACYL